MLDGPKAESVDRLLDELEALAASASPNGEFFRQLLQRLNFLLDAEGSAIILPARDESWLMLAFAGEVSAQEIKRLCLHVNRLSSSVESREGSAGDPREVRIHRIEGNHFWIGAPLRANAWKHGGVISSLSVEPPRAAVAGLNELVSAMAEIIGLRQIRELEKFFDDRWFRLQQAREEVSMADSKRDAACLLVNELLAVVGADRVSLVERLSPGKSRCLAVSGIEAVDPRAATVEEIERFADMALKVGGLVARRDSDGTQLDASRAEHGSILASALAIPFSSTHSPVVTQRTPPSAKSISRNLDTVVVLEWAARERFYEAAPLLHHLLPSFEQAWRGHRRWSRIPKLLRSLADVPGGVLGWFSSRVLRWVGVLLLLAGLLVLAQLPQELRIEASGTLEPAEQRTVFASADGYVERLLVEDGDEVQLGELVAVVRSPSLALQIQEFEGEQLTLAEKRSGLQIAINQLSPDDPTLSVTQSRLSAEIREIDAHMESVRELVTLLDSESQKLELRSPIRGVIVANELRRNLQSRPVRRGDALLRVVALDGAWRLELEVPDRDCAYVTKSYRSNGNSADSYRVDRPVEFVLAASPKQRFSGDVQWISNASRNPYGTGSFVDVHVNVPSEVSHRGHVGSTVLAFFSCGNRPWWFVWSRPLVEAIQRRMWF